MLDVIHIVRRYGSVGGMEHYVRQLTLELARKGCSITVFCENHYLNVEDVKSDPSRLQIVELGETCRKPRWLGQWLFSRKVSSYVLENIDSSIIIHSHERSELHHVTTFHGPPFVNRKKRFLDILSPRIHMWSYLEKRELTAPTVKAVLPNSPLIASQLVNFYPVIRDRLSEPAYPGVEDFYSTIERSRGAKIIGFMGKEWWRKGLDIACGITENLRRKNPEIHFLVAGCDVKEVAHLFKRWPQDAYTLAGWVKPQDFFGRIDVLLHPARAEPFGMVVAEANAVGVPVIISDQCGVASLIKNSQGAVLPLEYTQDQWAQACWQAINHAEAVPSLGLSWKNLANQHLELYQSIRNML